MAQFSPIIGIKVGPVAPVMESAQYWIDVNGGLKETQKEQRIISDKKDKITVDMTRFTTKYACHSLQDKWWRTYLAWLRSSVTLYPFFRKAKQKTECQ